MAKEKFIPKASIKDDDNNDISRASFISTISFGWIAFWAGV